MAWNLQNVELSPAIGRQNIRARRKYIKKKEVSLIERIVVPKTDLRILFYDSIIYKRHFTK